MPVHELARSKVVTVGPDATVEEIRERLRDTGVGSVVVEDEEPVGIITDRDLALEAADDERSTARDLMTTDLFTVERDRGIFEAIREINEAGVRRAPIVDDDGALVGIVTLDDLLVLLTRELGNLGEVIESESPPYSYETAAP